MSWPTSPGTGSRYRTERLVTEIRVRDFSDLSVRMEHWSEGELLYETVMIQGSPYVYLYPRKRRSFGCGSGGLRSTTN